MAGSILLADDEEKILKTLGRALRDDGHEVITASNAKDASRLLAERSFDLLIIDFLMPDRTGLDVIRDLAAAAPESERPAVVMMTAHGSIESAVEAMKLGARDYLQKPFEVDELLVLARRALEDQRARTGLRYLISERDAEFNHYGIIGRSRVVLDVIARAELVAESKSTVLLTGETGTGKELVARAIHARSAQRTMPMIKVNCAAIPETLLESELFGHVRGAFTGATFTKKGRFALAEGGTIFLDEIGTITLDGAGEIAAGPPGSRVRAARRRAHAAGRRAGDCRDQSRPAAAGLRRQVPRGPVLPPQRHSDRDAALRERLEDIPLLVEHFVSRFAERTGKKIDGVDEKAMAELTRYEWPGNVRELENTIERAVVLSTAPLLTSRTVWLMSATATPATAAVPSLKLHQNLEWAERETMRRALEQARGVKKDAAELMGISQRALSHYLAKYRIEG